MKHDPMRQGTLRDGWQIWPKPAAEGRRPALATRGRCRGLHGSPRGKAFSLKNARHNCYFVPKADRIHSRSEACALFEMSHKRKFHRSAF